jgi:hypothetical protein
LDPLGRQAKHREYFSHNVHDDICHHLGRRHADINIKALEENPNAIKEIEEYIVA